MVALNGTYQADPNATNNFDAVPPGEYQVMMVSSKMNAKNTGISCEFDIVSGEFQGRKLWLNLALFHDNQKAQEVGQRFLNDMCMATGKMAIADTTDLHGITMIAKVKLRKDDPSQNDIAGFKAPGGAPAAAVVQTAQAAPAPGNAPPWRR